MGLVTATEIARCKAHTILACRNEEKASAAVEQIKKETKNDNVEAMKLDLKSLKSVRQFVEDFKAKNLPLHILVNNAGIFGVPAGSKTDDGLELTMGVNHYGPFLLTNLLLDVLKKSAPARIVIISSGLHSQGHLDFNDLTMSKKYSGFKMYSNSKLANILFTFELARRLEGTGVTANCLHPGFVDTQMARSGALFTVAAALFGTSPQNGAQTALYLCLNENVKDLSGKYFVKCAEAQPSKESLDKEVAKKLWIASSNQLIEIDESLSKVLDGSEEKGKTKQKDREDE